MKAEDIPEITITVKRLGRKFCSAADASFLSGKGTEEEDEKDTRELVSRIGRFCGDIMAWAVACGIPRTCGMLDRHHEMMNGPVDKVVPSEEAADSYRPQPPPAMVVAMGDMLGELLGIGEVDGPKSGSLGDLLNRIAEGPKLGEAGSGVSIADLLLKQQDRPALGLVPDEPPFAVPGESMKCPGCGEETVVAVVLPDGGVVLECCGQIVERTDDLLGKNNGDGDDEQ